MVPQRTFFFILGLAVLAGLLGVNYIYQPFAGLNESLDSQTTAIPTDESAADQSNPTIDLTPYSARQKVAWLVAAPVPLINDRPLSASASAWLATERPGAVTLFGTRISTASAQTNISEILAAVGPNTPQPLIAVDHEGGQVQRLNGAGFTSLPSWQSLCAQPASQSAQLLQRSARELRKVGIDLVFAPMADLASNHPILRNRVCGEDPTQVLESTEQFIEIMAQAQIQPIIKHFPGIGQTTRDLHQAFDTVTVTTDEALLYQSLLNHYPRVGVMVSHVGVTNQFSAVPCSLSSDCVGQLTTNYPDALIVSDALEMNSARYQTDNTELAPVPEVAEAAVRAGQQLLVFGPQVSWQDLTEILDHLEAVYQSDPAFQQQVDTAVVRLSQVPNL